MQASQRGSLPEMVPFQNGVNANGLELIRDPLDAPLKALNRTEKERAQWLSEDLYSVSESPAATCLPELPGRIPKPTVPHSRFVPDATPRPELSQRIKPGRLSQEKSRVPAARNAT